MLGHRVPETSRNLGDFMQEFTRNLRFAFRKIWTWWETYLSIACVSVIMAAITFIPIRQSMVGKMDHQIQTLAGQNQRSIEDRDYLHHYVDRMKEMIKDQAKENRNTREELRNAKEALKRLESKVKSQESN